MALKFMLTFIVLLVSTHMRVTVNSKDIDWILMGYAITTLSAAIFSFAIFWIWS